MMICPHCGMYMKPMGLNCEFCGKDISSMFPSKPGKKWKSKKKTNNT